MALAQAPRLVAITDLSVLGHAELVPRLRQLAEAAVAGSVALLLRDHTASARQRLELGRELQDIARSAGQELWVADRLDLSLLLEANGVHLGEASVSARVARRLVGSSVRISRAWHDASIATLDDEELAAIDALLVSPVLAARKARPALGVAPLEALGEQLRARNQACKLYALGGISAENVGVCRAAGAFGVAAIGSALAPDPAALLDALELRR